jgi:hypothetical protein
MPTKAAILKASGRDLDAMVAEALGWIYIKGGVIFGSEDHSFYAIGDTVVTRNDTIWFQNNDGDICAVGRKNLGLFNPSTDIAAAWKLDIEGYIWRFIEFTMSIHCRLVPPGGRAINIEVRHDGTTADKARAYAEARCKAWLLARSVGG